MELGVKWCRSMDAWTRRRVASPTFLYPDRTLDTVDAETPASLAMS